MSNDLNCCQFIGRLGADPEQRFLPAGDAVTNFRIAVGWKSRDKEGTEWVACTTFGKLAEICGQYLRKGSQVFVQGKMNTRKWTDKEGNDRYSTEIRVEQMQMLGSKPEGAQERRTAEPAQPKQAKPSFDDLDDDIPF